MNQKPRILFILHLPLPLHGASQMGQYIHDSKVVNNTFECRYINLALARGIEDVGAFKFHKLNTYLKLIRNIRKEVKTFKPDVVYITPNSKGGAFYKEFVIVEMLKRMGCKVVAHFHNQGVRDWQKHWYKDLLYKAYFHNMKVILLAEALYADVCRYVDRKDVFICHNGIPDKYKKSVIKKHTDDTPHILFLSNLIISKGVLILLDALRLLNKRGIAFVCDIVGGETAEISKERLSQEIDHRNLSNMVVYHGSKYGEEKNSFFRNADVFAFPTYYDYECFPLVLLEAMSFGLPCISTNEGGIPDIIEDGVTGFIVPKQQTLPLADSLERLISDKSKCREMGTSGRQKYEQEFTKDIFENSMVNILMQCVCYDNHNSIDRNNNQLICSKG